MRVRTCGLLPIGVDCTVGVCACSLVPSQLISIFTGQSALCLSGERMGGGGGSIVLLT